LEDFSPEEQELVRLATLTVVNEYINGYFLKTENLGDSEMGHIWSDILQDL